MSIQAMIDAAPPGGTVNVPPGTYFEQLVIDKPLTLQGPPPSIGVAIVDAAGLAAVPTLQILSSQVTIRFMTFRNGPHRGILVGSTDFSDLEDILIENCTIQGHDLSGIMNLTHSAMDVVNSIIENNGSAVSFERAGIYLREHKNTNIIGNIIRNNNGEAIYAQGGNEGLLIRNNVMENHNFGGITLSRDQKNVTIEGNTIKNCGLGTDQFQGGIVIFQAMAERIVDNTITNCYRGIMWGWVPQTGPPPDLILISSNRISNSATDGIFLYSQGPGGFDPPDPFPLRPLISGNQIIGNGNAGVYLSNSLLGAFPNNANPRLDCNSIEGNVWGVLNQTATLINAVNNWWGDRSGPFHPVKNPAGTGNPVSDNVDFIPWKIQQPMPPPTMIDCVETTKVYMTCKESRIKKQIIDVSEIAQGEVVNVACIEVRQVVDQQHFAAVKKIEGTDMALVSFYFEYKIRFQDDTGWKELTSPPLICREAVLMPSLIQDHRINVTADIDLKCMDCFVSGSQQITCLICINMLLHLTSQVRLSIPTYGFS
ncbi:MAG: right-handed parallel beta-helix repeat-containing protein [Thermoanaerobacterales bacterium]|jgi:parallel beta-helix repeat protein|nr:right-handed parallel beta-helix repeat-containing protein [Thermoanaerobacterales bacterium]